MEVKECMIIPGYHATIALASEFISALIPSCLKGCSLGSEINSDPFLKILAFGSEIPDPCLNGLGSDIYDPCLLRKVNWRS